MISVLVSEGIKAETDLVVPVLRELFAKSGNESLEVVRWNMEEQLEPVIEQIDKLDAAILDVTAEGVVEGAKQLRRRYPEIEILIISEPSISPITYLNPEVRPASLLLKPLDTRSMVVTFQEFFRIFEVEEEKEDCLYVDKKGEKIRLPYQKIVYFEARDKRVYARMNNVEYGIYDTIDHMAELLPMEFVRCHRSYIVNYIYIEKVRYSENYIALAGNRVVPLSRSYKARVKEVMRGGA